jgi:hypothetical protein
MQAYLQDHDILVQLQSCENSPSTDNLHCELSQLNIHYLNSVSYLNGDFCRRKLQTTKLKTNFRILVRE